MKSREFEKYMDITTEVKDALEKGLPVVALESTIITHGMPYPKNVETALMVEDEIRKYGAVPATLAIIKGRLKIGLTREELDYVATAKDVMKCSRRDIAFVVAQKKDAGTTVATTMIMAEMAGIKVFATGGIGGVHRGAETSMDISADLDEFARTDVAVVCAGAKSILDIGLTLEYLETKGVPVIGYGTEEMPAFYTRESGFKVDFKIDSAEEIAELLNVKWSIGLDGGAIIANPIPEEFAMDKAVIDKAISQALAEATAQGIKGKKVTPFMLERVMELTGGESLESNIKLVLNNAKVASWIAAGLSKI
jgi:pseudouridine-5'-phosphate glycosidase